MFCDEWLLPRPRTQARHGQIVGDKTEGDTGKRLERPVLSVWKARGKVKTTSLFVKTKAMDDKTKAMDVKTKALFYVFDPQW